MPEFFEQESEPGFLQRYLGGWRVIASAWVVAIIVVLAFGGMQAFASRHVTSAHQPSWQQQSFVGAMIPRHDPSCGEPNDITPSAIPNCRVVGDVLERAEVQTEAEASYGY
ncbi:MAG: hypothetical protein JO007_14320 [Alphaproteobacteria bacterium]|nr:hypothetical protein [Alphaproteobacteria bacterium]